MNIAIIGLGNIGSSLYKYIKKHKSSIFDKTNLIPKIIYLSARSRNKKRDFKIENKLWINDYMLAVKSKNVDVIIELIGGAEGAAKKLVFSALNNSKHVLTANKALMSKYGDQLSKIAEKNKVNLEYEAAVCGGVPIIRTIKEGLVANKINKIYGILNGTSNYILSSMDKDKISYDTALTNAKNLGYAEANPKSDINGDDVASKLNLLTALSFNTFVNNKSTFVEGISHIDHIDINNANKLGYKIKLLGVAESKSGSISQRVHPTFVKNNSYVAKIDGVLNAVIIDSKPLGQSILQGEGAGPGPTVSALMSDLCSVLRGNIKYPFSIPHNKRKKGKFDLIDNKNFSVYLRLDVYDKNGVLSDITKIMSKNKISIKRLIQNPIRSKNYASIIIVTHKSKNLFFQNFLNQIQNKKYLINKPKIIRIESFE
jgi:homoserine dehydrogenase